MVKMKERLDFSQEIDGNAGVEQSGGVPNTLENSSRDTSRKSFDFKSTNLSDEGVFSGYASVFGNTDLDGDIIEPGAFSKSLASGNKIRLLSLHDSEKLPVGVITNAYEDQKGLFVEGKLTLEVQEAREIRALLKDGAIDSFSIGFRAIESEPIEGRNFGRRFKEIDIFEVSFVTFPANQQASVDFIKSANKLDTLKDVEKFLRAKGLSRKESETVISKVKGIQQENLAEDVQGDPVNTVVDKAEGDPLNDAMTKEFIERLDSMTTCLKFNNQLKELENV